MGTQMVDSLSIRAYTPTVRSHEHRFHQIVLPLRGVIEIRVDGNEGVVGVGQAVIIKKGLSHSFKAESKSRFLVADLDELPGNAHLHGTPFATISRALQSFCQFVDVQLQHETNPDLEQSMVGLFKQLLNAQKFLPKIDNRMSRVLAHIEDHLGTVCSLEELASIANLSKSQFKVAFKAQTGRSSGEYLMVRRMEKARALLTHSDLPVALIAEKVGYTNQSAFSRRFSSYFGEPPRQLRS